MHLAYVMTEGRGETDRLLTAFAQGLLARQIPLAGVVQSNTECEDPGKCDMDLKVLPDGPQIRISQSLGPGARGCRLDPSALEQAVGLVSAALTQNPRLLIVNKFGKHEAEGRGFRSVMGEALALEIPVLAGVNGLNEEKFVAFTEGTATRLENNMDALNAWVERVAPGKTQAA